MVTRQRGDLLMNIPALRKLDAMLIVSVSIYLYTCILLCSNFYGTILKHIRIHWTILEDTMSFGMYREIQKKGNKHGMRGQRTSGGFLRWKSHLMACPNQPEECFIFKKIRSHKSKKPPWLLMRKFYQKWLSLIAILSLFQRWIFFLS